MHADVPRVLSQLRGPWAMLYWQAAVETLWFGRDVMGKRRQSTSTHILSYREVLRQGTLGGQIYVMV